jgi:dirigent-like protein
VVGFAAIGLVASGIALATGGGQRSIRFLEIARPSTDGLIDHNGNRRPDPGDSLVTTSHLYRWAGSRRGSRLGRLQSICILATRSTGNCSATMFLPGGTLQIQGYVDFDDGVDELAVVGGTGVFVGNRGTFISQKLGGRDSARSSDTIRLVR